MAAAATVAAKMAMNHITQRQDAHWTNMAPIKSPSTIPIAPSPPKRPTARACSFGSGKMATMSVSAEGMLNAATARRR